MVVVRIALTLLGLMCAAATLAIDFPLTDMPVMVCDTLCYTRSLEVWS